MKRKTNLFYTTGTDSNFITFSNYTEALTGNFLSTETKLFPSRFLCMYIPSLDAKANEEGETVDRSEFIKRLAAYYENKLAFLRDRCVAKENYRIEDKIKALGYLLDFIYRFDTTSKINYVGQVCEQDYNGTFADTICVIDASQHNIGTAVRSVSQNTSEPEEYDGENILYGWSHKNKATTMTYYDGPEEYEGVTPEFDVHNNTELPKEVYFYTPRTTKINIAEGKGDIVFNVVIPLFDIINTNVNNNEDIISNNDTIDCAGQYAGIIDVPYGIWFAKETITLTRDNTDYSPSWSLAIGSQFKPFPYSKTPISGIDQQATQSAFATYSQILIRQNMLLDKMSRINTQIQALTKRVADVEANLASTGTSYNIDGLHSEIIAIDQRLKELNETINDKND